MKYNFLIFLFVAAIFGSCGEPKKSTQDALFENVMAVHDEIMAKMGDIMNYKKQLNEKVNILIAETEEAHADKIDELKIGIESLEKAHDEMMNWMHGFSGDFKEKSKKEILEYLNDQKKKIEQVGKITKKALTDAEELLGE